MTLYLKQIESPVGNLTLQCSATGLTAVHWHHYKAAHNDSASGGSGHPILLEAQRQLKEYFGNQRTVFVLPLDLQGTPFQKAVWTALLTIPFGETRSYGEIAHQIGNPKSVRAVGGANHHNPIPIIIPCHRVIGATGKLVGFGGGIGTKSALLALELAAIGKSGSHLHYRQQELFS